MLRKALALVRKLPLIHAPVHAIAERLARTSWGARLIRSVTEADLPGAVGYDRWIAAHPVDRQAALAHIGRMTAPPLISVVMAAYDTPPDLLKAAIASVQAQLYPHWELCIADDASPGEAVWRVLTEAATDPRIRIVRRGENGHVCAAGNSALALASGGFVAFMDHDDLLAENALYEVAAALERWPDTDLIYSDEDKVDARGRRSEPYFKPDWSPEFALGQNLANHLAVFRRAVVEELDGLRLGFEGAQDWDLVLRLAERGGRVRHVPKVLYHWRQRAGRESFSERDMARCAEAARRAVAEHLARTGQSAEAQPLPAAPGWLRVRRAAPRPPPLVSVIVPTRDRADLLALCADGVLNRTAYAPLELLIVDNGSMESRTAALFETLRADPRVRILSAPGPFNYSALNNRAAAEARGEILVLLNNDVVVRGPAWLEAMVAQAVRPQVGAVGAKLLYPDGRLQHGGVTLGLGEQGIAGHAGLGARPGSPGYNGQLVLAREVSAVTGACLALRREVFEAAGGLDDAELAVAFNDVDLCLKIRALGYSVIWTPLAELEHRESASRGSDAAGAARSRFEAEAEVMRRRWGPLLEADPFANPNIDRRTGTALA